MDKFWLKFGKIMPKMALKKLKNGPKFSRLYALYSSMTRYSVFCQNDRFDNLRKLSFNRFIRSHCAKKFEIPAINYEMLCETKVNLVFEGGP